MTGRAHGLLSHLALIHVSGRLVEIGIGREARHHAEDSALSEFLMRRLLVGFFWYNANVQVNLKIFTCVANTFSVVKADKV